MSVWRILRSKIFGTTATVLRRSIVRLTRIKCTNHNADSQNLEVLLTCRLISLDEKNPGLRPISLENEYEELLGKL